MADTWEALDALIADVETANTGWAEAREQRERERAAMATMLDQIEAHLRDFAVEAALDQIRERLLGGAGIIERMATIYNLERLYALIWPAAADPRPELSAAAGEYRITVQLGIGEQFRPRVLVMGAKRMEALLPVAADKFRAVLLNAVRNPAFAAHPSAEAERTEGAAAEADASHGGAPTTAEPAAAPADTEPGPVGGEEMAAAPDLEPDAPIPPLRPLAGDQPIAMGPAPDSTD